MLVITPAFDATFKSAALLGLELRGVSLRPPTAGVATSSHDYKLDLEEPPPNPNPTWTFGVHAAPQLNVDSTVVLDRNSKPRSDPKRAYWC